MKLSALTEAKVLVKKGMRIFNFSEAEGAQLVTRSSFESFDSIFNEALPQFIELKEITRDHSQETAKNMFLILTTMKRELVKMERTILENNESLIYVTKLLQNHQYQYSKIEEAIKRNKDGRKIIDNELHTELKEKLLSEKENILSHWERMQNTEPENTLSVLRPMFMQLEDWFAKPKEWKKVIKETVKELRTLGMQKKELGDMLFCKFEELDEYIYNLEEECLLQDFVEQPELQFMPSEVVKTVAENIHAFRDFSLYEHNMEDAQKILYMKHKPQTNHEVLAYATSPDLEICKEAKDGGVDRVAKKGLVQVSHNTFDVTTLWFDSIPFYKEESEDKYFKYYLNESDLQKKFYYVYYRQLPKHNSYLIFNIPFFKLHHIMKKIDRDLTIEGVYRVDDIMKNVLFVCRYKRDNKDKELQMRKIMLSYQSLPSYTEMEKIRIQGGDLVLPQTFKAAFVEGEDFEEAFKNMPSPIDEAIGFYQPSEKVVELNAPLQEYKPGHLPAVATVEVVNGINDTNELQDILEAPIDFPHIYSTKIVQRDVKEEEESMHKGKPVRLVTEKKQNVIVCKLLTMNGEIIELLNTK